MLVSEIVKLKHNALKGIVYKKFKWSMFYKFKNTYFRQRDHLFKIRKSKNTLKKIKFTQINSACLNSKRFLLWRRPSTFFFNKNVVLKFKNITNLLIKKLQINFILFGLNVVEFFIMGQVYFLFNKVNGFYLFNKKIVRKITRSFKHFRYNRYVFRRRLYRRKKRNRRFKPMRQLFGRWGKRFFFFFKRRKIWIKLPKKTKNNLLKIQKTSLPLVILNIKTNNQASILFRKKKKKKKIHNVV